MNLQIKQIIDYGTLASERVLFEVTADTTLCYYILADTTYTSAKTISNEWRHSFWFPSKEVKKGDEVILYTTKGKNSVEDLPNGKKRYTYYWKLGNSVWNNTGDAGVLFNVSTWKTTRVN